MKMYGGMALYLHAFLTSVLDEGEWSASRPGRFITGETAPRYPLDRRLDGPQSLSGRDGGKNISGSAGNRTPVGLASA
jgi:hypothetical protein